MKDNDRMRDKDRGRPGETGTAAERAARRQCEAEDERASTEPFDYPYPERRAGVRARRHVSEAQAAADMPPGIPGGYGTTGGGQPGAAAHPPPPTPRDTGATGTREGSAEPGSDDEGPVNRSGR